MFNAFKTFLLTAVLCINGIYSVPEQADSGSGNNQAPLNTSVVDYPLTLPVKILQQLAVDISDDSKGLFALWSNAFYLTKERLLTVEVSFIVHACMRMRDTVTHKILIVARY